MPRPRSSKLTPRQQMVLDFIAETIATRHVPPSFREIGQALKIASLRGVADHLAAIEAKGYLRRLPGARGLTLTPLAQGLGATTSPGRPAGPRIPIIGRVPAGDPLLAEEEIEGYLEPPAVEWGEACFALRVKGDSMIEAGILDGDIVIVHPQPEVSNGDIVVARLGEEATVKRFYRERSRIRLQPENSQLEPIYVSPRDVEVTIVGKVVGVQRRL